jgi:hypothetical protein
MGSGSKKKGGIDMGNYIASANEQTAYVWCINNNIYITPKAKSTTEWYICIVINKKQSISPEAYKKIDIWKQLYKYYLYYYNKYSNNAFEEVIAIKPKQKKVKVIKESSNQTLF